jgi:hypothetical protein
MAKIKTFCKWSSKDILKNIELLSKLTSNPKFVCGKCARVSNTKKSLCKPIALASKLANI